MVVGIVVRRGRVFEMDRSLTSLPIVLKLRSPPQLVDQPADCPEAVKPAMVRLLVIVGIG
ncbi:hypothetical protein N7536_009220 [Penicillium majusculum]|nr:hypothetical protein N7536_009220 [Penicillium majusculum]